MSRLGAGPAGTAGDPEAAAERMARHRARQAAAEAERYRRCGIGARQADPAGGTEETRARLKPDQLLRLLRRGKLDQVHLDAAEEIREVFEALTRQIGAKAQNLARLPAGRRNRRPVVQPVECLPPGLWACYVRNYRPWAEIAGATRWRKPGRGGVDDLRVRHLALVIEIVVDGRSLGEVAAGLRLRRRDGLKIVADILRESLELYAHMAGWRTRAPSRMRAAVAPAD